MDANPAPGAVSAVAGIDKAPETVAAPTAETEVKPTEAVAADKKPVEEKKDEPSAALETTGTTTTTTASEPAKSEEQTAPAPPADAPAAETPAAEVPKPASVEEVPHQDGPVPAATNGVGEAKTATADQTAENTTLAAAPATTAASVAEPAKPSVEEPIEQEPTKETVVDEESPKEPVIEKPDAVNGAATNDVEMTGALNGTEPTGAGEREAAPQAIPPEAKTGNKRKADDLDAPNGTNGTDGTNGTNGSNGNEEVKSEKPAEKKRKPGRPPGNGAAKKESLGHKVAKNVKKVLPPVGRTERKTRSQGPA